MTSHPLRDLRCVKLYCNGIPVLTSNAFVTSKNEVSKEYYMRCPACRIQGPRFPVSLTGNPGQEDKAAQKRAVEAWVRM
jgi:hypothetical protein